MAKFSWLRLIRRQYTAAQPVLRVDLTGQTVVVTGSNVGLGLETAKHFARMGPKRLVLACRNKGKGEAALAQLKKETGFEAAELMILDMSTFASVQTFVDAFEAAHERLDILVLNAAVAMLSYESSADGWESTIQVNHLSTALLALRLLPLMVKTGRANSTYPRLVIISSEAHVMAAPLGPDVLHSPKILEKLNDRAYCTQGVMMDRYNVSKMLNVFLTRELAARLPAGSPVVVDTVDPGFCHSELRRNVPFPFSIPMRIMEWTVARPTEEGARVFVWAALTGHDDPIQRDRVRGKYISFFEVDEESDFVLSTEGADAQRRIWDETLEILEKVDPHVQTVKAEILTG